MISHLSSCKALREWPGSTHHAIDLCFFIHLPLALNQKFLEAGHVLFLPEPKSSQKPKELGL